MVSLNKCVICGKSKFKHVRFTNDKMFEISGKFDLNECVECGILFLNPQPTEKELIKYYPSQKYYSYNMDKGKNSFFYSLRRYLIDHYYNPNLIVKIFSFFVIQVPGIPTSKAKGRILDLGCGNGETLYLLKQLGWDVYGIDIDSHAVKSANSNGLNNVVLGSYKDLIKYPDNFFDAIRLYHVIEHLDNPKTCFNLINKKLKKSGELIIATPNISGIIYSIFKQYWYHIDSPRHLFLFNVKTLSMVALKSGFNKQSIEYSSAGTILGSIQYFIYDKFKIKSKLLLKPWLVILIYPLEWIIDKLNLGDVIIIKFKK